jgi:DNA modification methylase
MTKQVPKIKDYPVITLNVTDIKKDPTNPNNMTLEQINGLEKSIVNFGRLKYIVVDQDNILIDGEHRLEVEKANGTTKVQVIQVPVKNEIERKMMRETLNQLHGDYDKQKQSSELLAIFENQKLDELAELLGRPREEFENLIQRYNPEISFVKEEDETKLPSIFDTESFVKRGEVWQLGRHRLMCGDSTEKSDKKQLFINIHPDIILTDPPYSSGGYQEAGRSVGSIGTRQNATILNDSLSTRGYLSLIKNMLSEINADVVYIFTDWRMWPWCVDNLESSGFPVKNMLVWDKTQMGMGFPWRTQHELIAFAKRTPAKMLDGKRGNVLQSKRTGNKNHPTEKPVDLLKQILDNTDGKVVYDPFLGSGSTLIACEQTNRICYGMEIDEHYCSVIIRRWEEYTNKKAVKLVDRKATEI